MAAAGRPLVRVVLDESNHNVEVVSPPGDDDLRPYREQLVAVDPAILGTRIGGLYRSILVDIFSGRMDPGG